MSYAAAVQDLLALGQELAPVGPGQVRRKFDLAHMRTLVAALGDPQRSFQSVLIAGTNGKGSTAATLASILATAGYRTALYTSPHLIRVNERIQVSSPDVPTEYASINVAASAGPGHLHAISDDDFSRTFLEVSTVAQGLVSQGDLPHPPSFFEVVTAIAFVHFAEQKVHTAVLEVGLGGRLDATNVVDPVLSILTDIALDHQEYLGDTIREITYEKAGILRPHGTLITLPQHPEANQAIGEIAADMPGLRSISAAEYIPAPNQIVSTASAESTIPLPRIRYHLSVDGEPLLVDSPLIGQHQQRNIALGVRASSELRNIYSYNITNEDIAKGIRNTRWPARLEFVAPNLLLDVAHNPAGAWTLRAFVAQLPEDVPRTLLFSCLRDKDLGEMSQILFPLFDASTSHRHRDHLVLAPIDNPRAAAVQDLLDAAHRLGVPAHASPHVSAALSQAQEVTAPGGLIVVAGSVYLVGQVRRHLLEKQ